MPSSTELSLVPYYVVKKLFKNPHEPSRYLPLPVAKNANHSCSILKHSYLIAGSFSKQKTYRPSEHRRRKIWACPGKSTKFDHTRWGEVLNVYLVYRFGLHSPPPPPRWRWHVLAVIRFFRGLCLENSPPMYAVFVFVKKRTKPTDDRRRDGVRPSPAWLLWWCAFHGMSHCWVCWFIYTRNYWLTENHQVFFPAPLWCGG